jgi:predicted nucleotidyltransferase
MNKQPIDKEKIIDELKKIGINDDNLIAVYLFGSNYWGYANENSDIDLYVITKKDIGIKQLDLEKISFRYISTLKETKEAISNGSWARYYVLKYASELLIGERIVLPKFPRDKVKEYINGKKEDIEKIPESSLKWGYLTLSAHIFLLNYFFYNSSNFSLDSYKESRLLNKEEKFFISELKKELFNHKDVSISKKKKIVKILEKIDKYILYNLL